MKWAGTAWAARRRSGCDGKVGRWVRWGDGSLMAAVRQRGESGVRRRGLGLGLAMATPGAGTGDGDAEGWGWRR